MSHLDYSNSVLFGCTDIVLKRFQRIQNMSAKLVLGRLKDSSSKEALIELHWLPIRARIDFKIICLMHKCTYGVAPDYLKHLLDEKDPPKRQLRNNSIQTPEYIIRFNRRKTFGDRAFSFSGPYLWNNLPVQLKLVENYDVFKKSLKTHLFKLYHNV